MTKRKPPPRSQVQRARRSEDPDGFKLTLRGPRGRPTTCTPALTRSVALHVATGNTIPMACEAVGLSYKTAEVWLDKGRKGQPPYDDFVNAMDEAKACWEVLAVRGITVAGRSDWKALAWLLERRAGARWRPPSVRNEHSGHLDLTTLTTEELLAQLRNTTPEEQ